MIKNMKIYANILYALTAILASLLLAGCSNNEAIEEEVSEQLAIDVVETGWQGETVSITTRAGETLEGLRDVYPAREWDSFEPDGDDITALNAATSLWTYDEGTKTYTSRVAINGTLAGGAEGTTELLFTKGLNFSTDVGNILVVNDGANSYISFTGVLTISNLKAGQTVTIALKSPIAEARTMSISNVSGSPVLIATPSKTSEVRTVANNGSVSFTAAAAINIYSIIVSRAEDLGFGIYCSELSYSNTQVTWDETHSRWNIGENNYHTYWKSNETGTINVYAYAPYKPGGYTVSADHKLTFVAQKHSYPGHTDKLSGGNVDLLQASASISRSSNNPAQLNFTHKLAKLTFGTITNNTGETIQLNGFTVSGTINSEAKLDLTNGGWSGHVSSTTSIQLPPPFVYVVHTPAEMAGPPPDGYAAKALIEPLLDKQTVLPNMAMGRSLLLIPNDNGEITVTVEVNNSTGETFSFPITLEEGKEKIVNITIGRNFEVVIE